ncbi:class E sortase [Microbacterium enclense]|uniref:class E sortase n=1 Tax=Microbacterium enclense TaxID=993073 RepID=UPI0021A861E8|nr:class E sortase [Microbacterium enclense]MCT2087538.1 class E sortase [Microbacterium enclense]
MSTVDQPRTRRASRRSSPRRRGISVVGILGDLLLTAGVVVLLFVGWQLWIGDAIIGAQFKSEAGELTEEWAAAPVTPDTSVAPGPAEPPALAQPGNGEVFGVLRIPRLGPDYQFKLAGGVSTSVTLDPIGIGHYPDTAMPGQEGNFAVAGHRGSHGAPFADLPTLRIGDAVVIETPNGWYTYRFRNLEYVRPDGVQVLLPVPQQPEVQATDKLITMTTCSPRFGSTERAIAYGVFESYTPRVDGPPASLSTGVA